MILDSVCVNSERLTGYLVTVIELAGGSCGGASSITKIELNII